MVDSVGAWLVGLGALLITVAYLALPFRRSTPRRELDRLIDEWIAIVGRLPEEDRVVPARDTVCPQCGRQANQGDQFCARCGARLPEDLL